MKLLKIDSADNVAVALSTIAAGEEVDVHGIILTVLEPVDAGHKIALEHIAAGDAVVKYGHPIGHTSEPISPGRPFTPTT